MDRIYELQAEVFRTLSHPVRIAMLHLLAAEPREVGRLAAALKISQPNASQHLAMMRAAGLVEAERDVNDRPRAGHPQQEDMTMEDQPLSVVLFSGTDHKLNARHDHPMIGYEPARIVASRRTCRHADESRWTIDQGETR